MDRQECEEAGAGEETLSRFAETFAICAQKLIPSTGWVTYVVGPELKIKHFLVCSTNDAERCDYEKNFAQFDPLSPRHCISNKLFVACLNEELSLCFAEHLEYRSKFMTKYRIVDAMEIFVQSDSGIFMGVSLIRRDDSPRFSEDDITRANALRVLGDFTMSQLLPKHLTGVEVIAERFPLVTPREARLIQLVVIGLSNKQICQELNISLPTVKSHMLNIFRKTNIRNRTELVGKLFGISINSDF